MPELVDRDAEHLRLLSIFHYIYAGITALFSCFGLFYISMGMFASSVFARMPAGENPPPSSFGYIFIAMGAFILILGWTDAILVFLAGRFLARHAHPVFCTVVAAVNCLWVPIGTVLGVATIVVLARSSTRALFDPVPAAVTTPAQS